MTTDIAHLVDANVRERVLLERVRQETERSPAVYGVTPEQTVITISREYGAGGHSVGEKLIEQLGSDWQLWDRQIVDAVARSAKVRAELAVGLDDRMLSIQEQILRYLVNCWTISPDRYYHHLVEVLVMLSHQGHKIIIGRGANFALPAALRVRLCASEKFRVDSVARSEGLTPEAARTKIRTLDHERASFVSTLFGRDIQDPSAYDLILCMDHISVEMAAAAIAAATTTRIGTVRAPSTSNAPFHLAVGNEAAPVHA